jgi:hypothetical protein
MYCSCPSLPLQRLSLARCAETGVEFGEALQYAMGFAGNDPALSNTRRNKFLMSEQLRASGGALPSLSIDRCWPSLHSSV